MHSSTQGGVFNNTAKWEDSFQTIGIHWEEPAQKEQHERSPLKDHQMEEHFMDTAKWDEHYQIGGPHTL